MSEALEHFLSTVSPEQYENIGGVEYLFQDAVESDKLAQVLSKFPRTNALVQFMRTSVLSYEPMSEGWSDKLLEEVQTLVGEVADAELTPPGVAVVGKVNYDTDEMFTLRATAFDAIWDNFDPNTVDPERAFLSDFLYGIDFTHWTKWAVLLLYTDLELRLPTILQARRNGVDFAIDGANLVYSLPQQPKHPVAA